MTRKSLTLLILACLVLIIAGSIFATHRANHRVLHVETDASSLKFEINDQTYTLHDESLDITLKPGTYKYRAISTVNDQRFVLTNTVDLTTEKSASLHFNFSIYSNQEITKVICASLSDSESDSCPFGMTVTKVDFAENFQWAVVWLDSPELGKSAAVLQVEEGEWKIVDGPATDLNTDGYFPESVERILKNEQ